MTRFLVRGVEGRNRERSQRAGTDHKGLKAQGPKLMVPRAEKQGPGTKDSQRKNGRPAAAATTRSVPVGTIRDQGPKDRARPGLGPGSVPPTFPQVRGFLPRD
ncbi:hypothetical protein GCM10023336_02060 [Streptomyces similanensis]|uniref:Uncharacterized protein n=1 Tax=Streptomyces similanensis TaxID=1274988 RepID=A0ABP9JTD4_9ACTN